MKRILIAGLVPSLSHVPLLRASESEHNASRARAPVFSCSRALTRLLLAVRHWPSSHCGPWPFRAERTLSAVRPASLSTPSELLILHGRTRTAKPSERVMIFLRCFAAPGPDSLHPRRVASNMIDDQVCPDVQRLRGRANPRARCKSGRRRSGADKAGVHPVRWALFGQLC
ncbi:hypothetical protein C8Q74DRAFT_807626 [Fomes fomentarius]|nr:hypothetical protein C8Q74DRAFT_807626 [Fomes fomentarius]